MVWSSYSRNITCWRNHQLLRHWLCFCERYLLSKKSRALKNLTFTRYLWTRRRHSGVQPHTGKVEPENRSIVTPGHCLLHSSSSTCLCLYFSHSLFCFTVFNFLSIAIHVYTTTAIWHLSLSFSLCINGVMTLVFIPFPHICFFIPALHMSCPLKPKVKCPPSPYLPTVTIKCFIHQSFPWWHIPAYSFVQCSQPLRTRREVLRSPTCSRNI